MTSVKEFQKWMTEGEYERIPSSFYLQSTKTVARALIGSFLCRKINNEVLCGRIVETEAYLGLVDPACHSFGGRKTKRTQNLYLTGGHSYVYFVYGMHYCFNVVTRASEHPEAVLIRAIEPVFGLERMSSLRPKARGLKNLTNGPAKLCQAFQIDLRHNRTNLVDSEELFLVRPSQYEKRQLATGPRIGIGYAGEAAQWPLRFFIVDNLFVSFQRKK